MVATSAPGVPEAHTFLLQVCSLFCLAFKSYILKNFSPQAQHSFLALSVDASSPNFKGRSQIRF